jgi:cytochrome c peroxidase
LHILKYLKKNSIPYILALTFCTLLIACSILQKKSTVEPLGNPVSPVDNPISVEKITLGRALFFDKRLSINDSVSCASCHIPAFAFTDRKVLSDGVYGRKTERNSPSVLNAGFLPTVMFDAHLPTLEMQVIVPIQEHVEMGMNMRELIMKLRSIPEYQKAASDIFDREFDPWVLTRSIAAFERSLLSQNSRFDQYFYGGIKSILTKEEKLGWELFSEKLYCIQCHPAPHFTNFKAENNGTYKGGDDDKGKFRIANDSSVIGKFKTPSLRNVELTYPYMHNGSKKTLEEVIDHYAFDTSSFYTKNKIIQPFSISDKEKIALIKFLATLTDTSYMSNF